MALASHPKRNQTPHDKKRSGAHHRPSKHYHKTYFPYLTMLAVLLCVFVFNSLWTPTRQVLGYASDLSTDSLLQRTNIARSAEGEQSLIYNDQLAKAAQKKAEDMAKRNYWSHTTPEGSVPAQLADEAGYTYTTIGENLAYGFDGSSGVVNGWLGSTDHRSNVLSPDYQDVGFGIVNAERFQGKDKQTIVVALYGQPSAAASTVTTQDIIAASSQPIRDVSRAETISTTNATLIAMTSAVLAAAAAMFVTLKHGRILKRALLRGELIIVRHHILDAIILGAGGIGFVITRSAGVIH